MSNNKALMIKDGQVVENTWALIASEDVTPDVGPCMVALETYLANIETLKSRSDIGVWLENNVDLNDVAKQLLDRPVIAIEFPAFMDGRGFSLARLLRERFGYEGDIRAIGHVIRDQLTYLKRCGFSSFCFQDDVDVEAAVASLTDFTEAYQTSVDQPVPLFKRRA